MDELRNWAMLACTMAVVCTLLYRLFPDTSLGKQGRMLLPCVFLCVILSPLLSLGKGLPYSADAAALSVDTEALEARVRQQTVEQVNATLLSMVNQALKSYGYTAQKVVSDMDIAADGSISMGQITVYVDEDTAQRSSLVKQVAQQRLGTAVVVVVGNAKSSCRAKSAIMGW